MYLYFSQICATEPNDNDESCKGMQCFLALLHYLQHYFEIKCHNSRYDWVTFQLLKSSKKVGLIHLFNSSRKSRFYEISSRASEESEIQA